MRQPSSPLERSPALRRAAFLALSAWMFAGPFAYQVLGDKRPWWRPWVMYREMGVGLYEVELRAETGGASRPAPWPTQPPKPLLNRNIPATHARALTSPADVADVVGQVCADLPEGARLTGRIRRATEERWETKVAPDRNLCAPPLEAADVE